MAYAKGPYNQQSFLPLPSKGSAHSARSIDFTLGRVEVDEQTGAFKAMPPNSQRVALLISFEVEDTKFITPQSQDRTRKQIRTALTPLTDGDAPLIEIISIDVGSDRAGTSFRRVVFRDLTKNDPNVVQSVKLI